MLWWLSLLLSLGEFGCLRFSFVVWGLRFDLSVVGLLGC